MIDLDQRSQYAEVDTGDMLQRLMTQPQQLKRAWQVATEVQLPASLAGAEHIVICGMGGSAIGGDLIRSVTESAGLVPIAVNRGYQVPGYVGSRSLVLLSSFSGQTEETLAAAEQALQRGARVAAVTTGGAVAELARQRGFPVASFTYPGKPREAIGYSTLVMLGMLGRLGYVPDYASDVQHAVTFLADLAMEFGPAVPADHNRAKRLAQRLFGRVVVVYGGGLLAEVARRWKGQFNENAKTWAFFEQLPELNHNALLGYRFPTDGEARHIVVLLSSPLGHPGLQVREDVTVEFLRRWGVPVERVVAMGASPLEQLLSTTYFGDFVSYYLALINDVDPSEDGILADFKTKVAQRRAAPE